MLHAAQLAMPGSAGALGSDTSSPFSEDEWGDVILEIQSSCRFDLH